VENTGFLYVLKGKGTLTNIHRLYTDLFTLCQMTYV
jgi:hypothetical protein